MNKNMSKELEVLEKLTKYHQISKDSELNGKEIKYSSIDSYAVILVFTDQTFVYAEYEGSDYLDDASLELNLGLLITRHPGQEKLSLSHFGRALEIENLEPYLDYIHEKEAAREDQEYQEFLRLRAKYGYKDETDMA